MNDIIKLLYKIRKNPAMYFGNRRTITQIKIFIWSFITGRKGTNKEIDESTNWFGDANHSFQDYVIKRLDTPVTNQSWDRIIEFNSSSQDEAYKWFFRLLDEFLEQE